MVQALLSVASLTSVAGSCMTRREVLEFVRERQAFASRGATILRGP